MSSINGQSGEFHIDATVQSQYAASPRIRALVDAFWASLDPGADLKLIYDRMVNPETAEGFGLDVWGRIVAQGREYMALADDLKYFGFEAGVANDRLGTFGEAPFYAPVDGLVRLNDGAYRTYIFIKAMINIMSSTLYELNLMLSTLFPDADLEIQHTGTMVLRLLIRSRISTADKTALLSLPWLPAGVGLDIYQVVTPTFGFNGSLLHPFNNGTFATFAPVSQN